MDEIRRLIERAEKENNAKILTAKKMSLESEIRKAFKKIDEVRRAEERFRRRF